MYQMPWIAMARPGNLGGAASRGPGMPRQTEFLGQALTVVGTFGSNALAWLQGPGVGAAVTGLTMLAFGLIAILSHYKRQRSKDDNDTWQARQKVEREERAKTVRAEIRLKALREKADQKSLESKNKQLEQRVADLEHSLEQTQVEILQKENREVDLVRMLQEAQANAAALASQLGRVQGQVNHVETKVESVKGQVEDNTQRIERVEQSGEMPAVKPGEGTATTG